MIGLAAALLDDARDVTALEQVTNGLLAGLLVLLTAGGARCGAFRGRGPRPRRRCPTPGTGALLPAWRAGGALGRDPPAPPPPVNGEPRSSYYSSS